MNTVSFDELEFRYESSASDSYIVVRVELSDSIISYQTEMITRNNIDNILSVNMKYKDEVADIYYNITSKIALSQFLKRKKLKKSDFISILYNIAKTLLDTDIYLLYDNCFILTEEYIFINPETGEIFLMYLPLKLRRNIKDELKDFVVKLITVSADIEDSEDDGYIQKVIGFFKREEFSLQELNKFLWKLKSCEEDELKSDKSNLDNIASKETDFGEKIANKNKSRESNNPNSKVSTGLSNAETAINMEEVAAANRTRINIIINKKTLVFILIQCLVITILIAGNDFIKKINKDVFTIYAAIILVIGASEILLYRNIVKKNKIPGEAEIRQKSNDTVNKWSLTDQLNKSFETQFDQAMYDNANNMQKFESEPEVENSVVSINETVYLNISDPSFAYLKNETHGSKEVITITKDEFIFGRLKDQVDYEMDNVSIGKVHAEISGRKGIYFIKDLNSKNGTYLNNIRIESNKEFEIRDGDKVSFANCDYTFYIPKNVIPENV